MVEVAHKDVKADIINILLIFKKIKKSINMMSDMELKILRDKKHYILNKKFT